LILGKGWVKAGNFSRSSNKKGYASLLTPSGIEAKARLTVAFRHRKVAEYEQLQQEIEALRQEVHTLQQKPAEGPQ
jgi:cell division protein FtsB